MAKMTIDESTRVYDELTDEFKKNFNEWICYWRKNPHRFVTEYFGVPLADFQKILLYCMFNPQVNMLTTFDWFASRGLGKTFITMLFSVAIGTLYPGLEITTFSASYRAAKEFARKIYELETYPNIAQEIESINVGKEESIIKLKSGTNIMAKVCNVYARGARNQIVIFDERVIMDSTIIKRVCLPMLSKTRKIPAYDIPQYSDYRKYEKNHKIYLSSVGYSDDEAYKEFMEFGNYMEQGDRSYMTFSLPYQFGVKAGIIDESLIRAMARENRANIEDFQSEMEVIPIGSNENAIFNYYELNNARQIIVPLIEPTVKQFVEVQGDITKLPGYVKKQYGEIRVLSVDIATALGRKNDASAWTMFRLFNKGDYYEKHVPFHKAINGMNVDAQVLYTKRLWHYFDVDYIVIDAGGAIGIAFATLLGAVTSDLQLGITYPGFKTMNRNEKFDIRVADEGAVPNLYCMQVSGASASQMQADMSFIAKCNFERNQIFLLIDDLDAVDELNDRYKYMKLKTSNDFAEREIAANMINSFLHTNELVHEMLSTKLKRLPSGRHTIEEKSGERKDRMISLLYGCYFISSLEQDLVAINRSMNLAAYAQQSYQPKTVNSHNPFAGRSSFRNGFGSRR